MREQGLRNNKSIEKIVIFAVCSAQARHYIEGEKLPSEKKNGLQF